MKSCDQVFAILTRGPFPSGDDSDAVVEDHLARCEGCRRLAEALRPPVEIFQETVAPEESRTLPTYWGDAGLAQSNLSVDLDEEELPAIVPHRSRWPAQGRRLATRAMQFFTAVLCAALFAVALEASGFFGLLVGGPREQPAKSASPPVAVTVLKPALGNTGDPNWLAMLDLPAACRRPEAEASTAPHAMLSHLVCCTRCHAAERLPKVSAAATQTVARSCQACH